ncbi:MAG: 50S ribosomal protein L24 [Chitinophagales bacterium]|jgi:large subunit ribosomal protein L24|nr:50S ribosomal protein L24 [Chitinophagales bacterium]HNL06725.1 50S ribosomal protein L24 [Chitinophagales bacterium]
MKNSNQSKRFKPKYHIKTGDTVVVLSGDDKGKRGHVLGVDTKSGRAIVEGVNIVTKHQKPTAQNTQGRIDKVPAMVPMCKLMLIDPATGAPTRIGRKSVNGKSVRYAKKSGEVIN